MTGLPRRVVRAAPWFFLTVGLATRVVAILRFRVSSDEPQHLHVIWAWTQGLVQYRDVFDNHSPLFQLLMAPVLALLPERPDIVVLMRLAQLPLFLAVLGAAWVLGRRLGGRTVALWSMALVAITPRFFYLAVELRPFTLWVLAWFALVLALTGGPPTPRRGFAAGLCLGFMFSISLKTVMVPLALLETGVLLLVSRRRLPSRALGSAVVAGAVGALIPPALLAAAFAGLGAWREMVYGTVTHNVLPHEGSWGSAADLLRAPVETAAVAALGWWLARRPAPHAHDPRAVFVFLFAGFYLALLAVWPLVTGQTFAAVFPLLVVSLTTMILGGDEKAREPGPALARRHEGRRHVVLVLAGLAMTVDATATHHLDRNLTLPPAQVISDVLRLTRPGDTVLDLKGESVFRRRPVRYVLERLTRDRMKRGLMSDDGPERLTATRTAVVVGRLDRYPPATAAFVAANYVSVGRVRVLGRRLGGLTPGAAQRFDFTIVVPAEYALFAGSASPSGMLDGMLYDGPRLLAPGTHHVEADPGSGDLFVIWAPALAAGFRPQS
jgi:hypothetical protein